MKLRLEIFFFIQCSIYINDKKEYEYSYYCKIMKNTHQAKITLLHTLHNIIE